MTEKRPPPRPSCAMSCNGCCAAGGTCFPGNAAAACGRGGQTCVSCGAAGCSQGRCESCSPQCMGKLCGAGDGCGGTCASGSGCCSPQCTGKLCGAGDGCGGTCASGSGCETPCVVSGVTVNDGASRVFYSTATVPFGASCETFKQTRTCTHGVLSGTFPYLSCAMQKLKVLLWNILKDGWEPTSDYKPWNGGRKQQVISLAAAQQADVMLFQEVSPTMYQDLVVAFPQYVSHVKQKTALSIYGNAIFSKLPMSNKGGFVIDDATHNCASAVIAGVNVYSCHLPNQSQSAAYRQAAAKVVAQQIKAPLILGGDLNDKTGSTVHGLVVGGHTACGSGFDHLVTGLGCSLVKIIACQANGYPSDHDGLVLTVPK